MFIPCARALLGRVLSQILDVLFLLIVVVLAFVLLLVIGVVEVFSLIFLFPRLLITVDYSIGILRAGIF